MHTPRSNLIRLFQVDIIQQEEVGLKHATGTQEVGSKGYVFLLFCHRTQARLLILIFETESSYVGLTGLNSLCRPV